MKKILSMMCVLLLAFSSTAFAANATHVGKTESIYGLLGHDGNMNQLYVVNGIKGLSKDYGNYKAITNLTTQVDLIARDGFVEVPKLDEGFYYQGSVEEGMSPWYVTISYSLDGQAVSAQDLAGTSGSLEIKMIIEQGHPDKSYFYDHYMLQIGLAIPEDKVSHLEAQGGMVVDAAGKKRITYTTLPGEISEIVLKADVSDFEMDAITMNGVKLNLDLAMDTTAFTNQFEILKEAVSDLDDGAGDLLVGARELENGLLAFKEGYDAYASGISDFTESGLALANGLSQVDKGLTNLNQHSSSLKAGLLALEESSLKNIQDQLLQAGLSLPTLTKDNYLDILGSQPALKPYLEVLGQTFALTQGLSSYIEGVEAMTPHVSELSRGMKEYVSGASEINEASQTMKTGIWRLNQGMASLTSGLATYKKGTGEFKAETSDLDQDIAEEIDEIMEDMLGDDAPLESFMSRNNEAIDSVQFFYRTEKIAVETKALKAMTEKKDETLWDRLANLFQFN